MKFFTILMLLVAILNAAIDINKANQKELMSLKGIGEKRAKAITDHRSKHCFKNVDELKQIKGIGDEFMRKNRHNLKASPCRR